MPQGWQHAPCCTAAVQPKRVATQAWVPGIIVVVRDVQRQLQLDSAQFECGAMAPLSLDGRMAQWPDIAAQPNRALAKRPTLRLRVRLLQY